jgi:hypothetical protein
MNTNEIVSKKLVDAVYGPVKEHLLTRPIEECLDEDGPKRTNPFKGEVATQDMNFIRLDWELSYQDDVPRAAWKNVVPLMLGQLRGDIEDLLINGDTESEDPLFKALDGALKRGKNLKSLSLTDIHLFEELRPKKMSYEYTVYFRLTTEWES